MTSDIEPELHGSLDIAAQIETWWRSRRRRVSVSRWQVERWIKTAGLPVSRVGRGPFTAAPSEVCAWCERVLSVTTSAQVAQVAHSDSLTRTL